MIKEESRKLQHIGFIVDGNGRWAKAKHMPRSFGHSKGLEVLEKIVKECFYGHDIPYVSAYVFSTENWKRPKDEVDYLMNLFRKYLNKDFEDKYPNVKLNMIGNLEGLPEDIAKAVVELQEKTKDKKPYTFNLALNYGSHDEISNAVNEIIQEGIKVVTPEIISNHLKTKGQPNVDLVIRTSGECRLSNFMLWQLAYTELAFTKTFWPAFTKKELKEILHNFFQRDRRFGGIKK